jgi:nitronate monooxygenase
LGTRFVATQESSAHPDYKRALVQAAGASDTVCTTCLNKGWPNVSHRILLSNSTFQTWEAAGCPPEGQRPGEDDIVGYAKDGSPIERYRINIPVAGMSGAVLEMGTFAGTGVGAVRDLPPAGDLVRRLWSEYEQAI